MNNGLFSRHAVPVIPEHLLPKGPPEKRINIPTKRTAKERVEAYDRYYILNKKVKLDQYER